MLVIMDKEVGDKWSRRDIHLDEAASRLVPAFPMSLPEIIMTGLGYFLKLA